MAYIDQYNFNDTAGDKFSYPYFEKLDNEEQLDSAINETPDVAKIVISLIICVVGIIGNITALFVIIVLREYRKSVTHWYVLQLAIADSIFLLTLPFKVSEYLNTQWIYPEWMCKAKETILFLNYYASILFLTIMSTDRYIAVCHTLSVKVQVMRKPGAAFVITIITWIISLLLCIPVMLYSFKAGFEPHCKCSYEFPRYDSQTIRCMNEGLSSTDSVQSCLNAAGLKSENLYCRQRVLEVGDEVFEGFFSQGGVDPSLEDLSQINRTAFLPLQTGLPGNSAVSVQAGCHYWDSPVSWFVFLGFNFSVMFLVPLFVMIVCYGLIVKRLSESRMRTSSQSSVSFTKSSSVSNGTKKRKMSSRSDNDRRRVTIMCATLVSCFVICWLPFHAVHLAKIAGIHDTSPQVCESLLAAGSLLGYINSALNPYLYSLLGTNVARRWRMLKKSRGIRHFISMAAWKHSESTGSNRHLNSRAPYRNRNESQNKLNPYSNANMISPPQTQNTRLSILKTTDTGVLQAEDGAKVEAGQEFCQNRIQENEMSDNYTSGME